MNAPSSSRLSFRLLLLMLFSIGSIGATISVLSQGTASEKTTAKPIEAAAEFQSIFDGKTLSNWKGDETFWRAENGTIVAESTPGKPCKTNSFLVWQGGKVRDFELKLKYKITGDASANSGIQFRSALQKDGHVKGYQADIDKQGKWLGMCYDELGRGILCQRGESVILEEFKDKKNQKKSTQKLPTAGTIFKTVKQDDWNDYSIRAVGNRITIKVNGIVSAEIHDKDKENVDLSGILALQLHSGSPMKIAFKEIQLKTISKKKIKNEDHPAKDATSKLHVYPGLKAKLFASEPMMFSPSGMDVDHLGRIWVSEVVNYRNQFNKDKPVRPEGDRILVLEDTNGDGKADKSTTFYQGTDIDGVHGVHCYGDKIFVSTSNTIFEFTDGDGDLKPEKKKILFTAYKQGKQHDHGLHPVTIGPDGKMYFSFGNYGGALKDKDGKVVTDRKGNPITDKGKPYRQGMVFRCNVDGTDVETLAWNFRNNWELAVDSLGNIWQSDNDDDGNRGVRINYVMEGGNYGYVDELTGAGWRTPRTGQSKNLQERQWHQNDPGVVPNLINTGSGSPTGICIYEGTLLPEIFQNQILHCDAGPNIVRCFPVTKKGAGYTAKSVTLIDGSQDNWFRPTSVRVAPDGSVFVADWYDPGVGGHRMGDTLHGRIFRIAPSDVATYRFAKPDFKTAKGAIAALQSPNVATRNLAAQSLRKMEWKAFPEIHKLMMSSSSLRMQARALWLLGSLPPEKETFPPKKKRTWGLSFTEKDRKRAEVGEKIEESGSDLRTLAILVFGRKFLEEEGKDIQIKLSEGVEQMVNQSSLPACRILLLFLANSSHESKDYSEVWTLLANRYHSSDRFYLEALGIAAEGEWDVCLAGYFKQNGFSEDKVFEGTSPENLYQKKEDGADHLSPQGKKVLDIVWRSRGEKTPEYLRRIIANGHDAKHLHRYFRAFDFQPESQQKTAALASLAFDKLPSEVDANAIASEAIKRLKNFKLNANPKYKIAVERILKDAEGTSMFVSLVSRFSMKDKYPALLEIAQKHSDKQLGVDAIRVLFAKRQQAFVKKEILKAKADDALKLIRVVGLSEGSGYYALLVSLFNNEELPTQARRLAMQWSAKSPSGARRLANMARDKKIPEGLGQTAAAIIHAYPLVYTKEIADKVYPLPPTKNAKPLPSIKTLAKRTGDMPKGRLLFHTTATCAKCHEVNGQGRNIGPDLSEIGKKLSKQAMYESILFPSAAISHNYESYLVITTAGKTYVGLKISETAEGFTLRNAEGIDRKILTDDILKQEKQKISMMPANLQKLLSEDDFVDIVEYMTTLKKKSR